VIRGSIYISRFLTKVHVITFLLSHGEIHNMEIKINIIYIKYKFIIIYIILIVLSNFFLMIERSIDRHWKVI